MAIKLMRILFIGVSDSVYDFEFVKVNEDIRNYFISLLPDNYLMGI